LYAFFSVEQEYQGISQIGRGVWELGSSMVLRIEFHPFDPGHHWFPLDVVKSVTLVLNHRHIIRGYDKETVLEELLIGDKLVGA